VVAVFPGFPEVFDCIDGFDISWLSVTTEGAVWFVGFPGGNNVGAASGARCRGSARTSRGSRAFRGSIRSIGVSWKQI